MPAYTIVVYRSFSPDAPRVEFFAQTDPLDSSDLPPHWVAVWVTPNVCNSHEAVSLVLEKAAGIENGARLVRRNLVGTRRPPAFSLSDYSNGMTGR